MTLICIVAAFFVGALIGFGATAAGVAALICDGQLEKTARWYEADAERKAKKGKRKS